jgi:hypothetical protein
VEVAVVAFKERKRLGLAVTAAAARGRKVLEWLVLGQ